MNKEYGKIETALVVVILVFIVVGMLAFPKLLATGSKAENAARKRLEAIRVAEQRYLDRFGGRAGYGTLDELAAEGFLTADASDATGKYLFKVSTSNRPLRFCVTAVPLADPKAKSLALTQSGPIVESPAPIECFDGEVRR